MPIGVFGGTFDPVHTGHLLLALRAYELRRLEKVIFIPAFISPFRQNEKHASGRDRLNMLTLAAAHIPFFEVSDYELSRETVSYSVDTLRFLKNSHSEIELIIGEDQFAAFDKWKDPDVIFSLCTVVVMRRSGHSESIAHRFKENAVYVDTPLVDLSATEIRARVQEKLLIDFFVPEPVKTYIYERNLYDGS